MVVFGGLSESTVSMVSLSAGLENPHAVVFFVSAQPFALNKSVGLAEKFVMKTKCDVF